MRWKWLTRLFWLLLLLVVLYFVIIRAALTWVTYTPQTALNWVGSQLEVQLEYDDFVLRQTWSGFELQAQALRVQAPNWRFNAQKLAFDFNLWSPWWRGLSFGEEFVLHNAGLSVAASSESLDASEQEQAALSYLAKTWHQLDVVNFAIRLDDSFVQALHIQSLRSQRGARWSMLGQVSVIDRFGQSVPFSLSARLSEDYAGVLSQAQISIRQDAALPLAQLYENFPLSDEGLAFLPQGEVRLALEVDIAKGRLAQVSFQQELEQLHWPQSLDLPQTVSLQWLWHSHNAARQSLSLEQLLIDHQPIPLVSGFNLQLSYSDVKGYIDDVYLDTLSAYLNQSTITSLPTLKSGQLQQVYFHYDLDESQLVEWASELKDFDIHHTGWSLALEQADLHYQAQRLNYSAKQPLSFHTEFTGQSDYKVQLYQLAVDFYPHGWSADIADMMINDINASLNLQGDVNGWFDAELSLAVSDMQTLKASLLPYGLMDDSLVTWLDESLVAGDHIRGQAYWGGRLTDFPFEDHQGYFYAQAQVDNAVLDFHPDWPALTDFSAELFFSPYDLQIVSKQAHIHHAIASDVVVDIRNLVGDDIAVEFSGRARTEAQNGLDFLLATPLAAAVGIDDFLAAHVRVQGEWHVELERVFVPVLGYEGLEDQVSGWVEFTQSEGQLFDLFLFEQVSGRLDFTETGVSAQNIQAQTWQSDVYLDVSSQPEKQNVRLAVRGETYLDDDYNFSGKVPWHLDIQLPYLSHTERQIYIDGLALTDKLDSHWPAPFSNKQLQGQPFHLAIVYENEVMDISASWIDAWAAQWQADFKSTEPSITRSLIQINAPNIDLSNYSDQQGYKLDANIDEFDVELWFQTMNQIQSWLPDASAQMSSILWHPSNIHIDSLMLNQHAYQDLHLNFATDLQRNTLHAQLVADAIKAELHYHEASGLDIAIDYLTLFIADKALSKASSEQRQEQCQNKPMSTNWPDIRFRGQNMFIGHRLFDEVRFNLSADERQLVIDEIDIRFANRSAQGRGQYIYVKNDNLSRANLHVDARDAASFTSFIGIKQGFTGRRARLRSDLHWQGGLNCASLDQVKANFDLRLDNGVIEEIEPGIARLIGLLSVDSLVRRLRLDMKDVTQKGLEYDVIEMQGRVDSGIVNLRELSLTAPSVKAEMKGKIGLLTEDFELQAKVTPAIGGALPTIAGLLGLANPLTGLLTYFFAKQIPFLNEDIITYYYDISGSWEEPEVKSKGGSALFQ